MDRSRVGMAVALTVVAVAVVGVLVWRNWPERVDPAAPPPSAKSFDQLMAELAGQTKRLLGADDFTVVVTQSAYPVGTLLRPNSTVPVDDEACIATPAPTRYDAPNFAPELKMSRQLAASVGLADIAPILGGSGAETKASDEMSLSFVEPGYRILSDRALAKTLASPACHEALSDEPRWLVRGYVSARRKLVLSNTRESTVKAEIERVSTFKVSPLGSSQVSLVDDRQADFLQLVSVVQRPKVTETATRPPAFTASAVVAPPAAAAAAGGAEAGRIYVQRDKADRSARPQAVVEALKAADFRVPGVEAVATKKMPATAQVRYFNKGDLATARRVASLLGKDYPGALVLEVGLPAPKGQLEVWLPNRLSLAPRAVAAPAPSGRRPPG